MTQPAVHGQFQQDAPHQTPHDAPLDAGQTRAQGTGPEAASGRTAPETAGRAVTWRKAAFIAAAGIPVGLLWWLLAPSGLNLLSGNPELRGGGNTEGWLPRDLVLAGLFLLAGCISGAVASGSKHSEPSGRDVLLAVGAGALGALAAWGTGVLCGLWWGTTEDTSANASIAFSLRSLAFLAIWPAAAALTLFLNTVFTTPKREAGHGTAEQPSAQGPE
jgi:hypothetical protein